MKDDKFFDDMKKNMFKMINKESDIALKELTDIFGDKETIEVTAKDLIDLHKKLSKNVARGLSEMALIVSAYVRKNYVKKPQKSTTLSKNKAGHNSSSKKDHFKCGKCYDYSKCNSALKDTGIYCEYKRSPS